MIGWLDLSAGASGDMLLAALVDAGAPLDAVQQAVDALPVERVALRPERVQRGGLAALRVHVEAPVTATTRTWADVRSLLEAVPEPVRTTALEAFRRLAEAEGEVHGTSPDDVHFHEVGALDALADVVGVSAAWHALGAPRLTASPVSLGSGATRGAHGALPVPSPAVVALLRGAPVQGGAVPHEMTTPTGAALVAALVTEWGPLPPMSLRASGSGAGGRDPDELPNVLRVLLGEAAGAAGAAVSDEVLLECNVDDLDPRLWPGVLDALLAAGAADAWLTPVLMKKGRPAHRLSVLCRDPEPLRQQVFALTTTLGVRETRVRKTALDRSWATVDVDGQVVRIKSGGTTRQPEWEDVRAAAAALGRPEREVLAQAQRLAWEATSSPRPADSGR